ncbi:MAG: glycine--tRNA ligase [Nitrososphaerota archaeon]|nr:glycine--tRNA ligase [Nitrososphaerota archaeon]
MQEAVYTYFEGQNSYLVCYITKPDAKLPLADGNILILNTSKLEQVIALSNGAKCSKADCDKFVAVNELAKRRGFFWNSFEIYGGSGGFVTYGPLGTRLKQNIEAKLREFMIKKIGIYEIESSVIVPDKIFVASGHVAHFKEPMVECQTCHTRFRADHLLEEKGLSSAEAEKMSLEEIKTELQRQDINCPDCKGPFGEPTRYLTMFETTIGPYAGSVGYGRPEAAQNIFVEFNRLYNIARERLPFGCINIGRALRNEISPRQGLIRLREFTIADLEFFFDPEESSCERICEVENEILPILLCDTRLKNCEDITPFTVREALNRGIIRCEWQAYFMAQAKRLLTELGVPAKNQRFIEKHPWEKAHYSTQSFDQEVLVDRWGWIEVSGHAYRTDYDLACHMKASGVDMTVYKEYLNPVETEALIVKPIMSKLGPVYKDAAGKSATALAKVPAQQVADAMEKDGYIIVEGYQIFKEQVEIGKQKTTVRGKRFVPHVVEPSFGCDRLFYVALEYAYGLKDDRVVLSFPRSIAPIQINVYPLMNKDGLDICAKGIQRLLVQEGFMTDFDDAGSIGRRYARADEAGVQLGITIDYDTLSEQTVTIRDRDTWKQIRVAVSDLSCLLHRYFEGKADFEALENALI